MQLSLRWKIILLTVVPVIIIHLAATALSIINTRDWTTTKIQEQMADVTHHWANYLDGPTSRGRADRPLHGRLHRTAPRPHTGRALRIAEIKR